MAIEPIEAPGSKRKKVGFPVWEVPFPPAPPISFHQPLFLKLIFDSLSRVAQRANRNTANDLRAHVIARNEVDNQRFRRMHERMMRHFSAL